MKTLLNNNDCDGFDFLRKQMRQEQELSQGLNLRSSTQQQLQARHSVATIAGFFKEYAHVIEKQHYLYVLPSSASCTPSLYPNKPIHTVDSYRYALYSRDEYNAAIQANMSKEAFLDIRRREPRTKKSSNRIIECKPGEDDDVDVFNEPVDAKPSLSLKRVSTTAHLDKILEYGNGCIEEEVPNNDRQLKRYKKETSYRERIDELKYQVEMERELRSLQAQIHAKKVAAMEARLNALHEENVAKDREIARRDYRPPQQPTPRRAAKPKPKKATAHQQQPIDAFLVHPPNHPLLIGSATQEETERAHREEQERIAVAMAQLDADIEAMLIAYTENGSNVGIAVDTSMKLAAYIEKFLDATNAPNANRHLRDLLDHPFLVNYRVSVMANMTLYAAQNDRDAVSLMMQQKREVLDASSLRVRYNISNTNIHAWFLIKATELCNTTTIKHRPVIMSGFSHRYAPEILSKWYPYLDSGNGYIITPDLKIVAVANLQGQGHGKHCCYCNLQYVACRNGVLKHAHQVKNCDYIANASNDERVILQLVLAKAAACEEFNTHAFIAKRDDKSLLRLATPEEEAMGHYVVSVKGERLRINMSVLLAMRARSYKDFTSRIDSLDTHKTEMNLNAQPFAYQLDCFGHNAPRTRRKNKKSDSDKKLKEDGFLYKTLIDSDGHQFRKTKFSADGKTTLRDFTLREDGFGDDMFFSMPIQLSAQEISQQAEAHFLQNMAMFGQVEEQQCLMHVEEENGFSFNLDGYPQNEWLQASQPAQLEDYQYSYGDNQYRQ